jgi:hypothetical protein
MKAMFLLISLARRWRVPLKQSTLRTVFPQPASGTLLGKEIHRQSRKLNLKKVLDQEENKLQTLIRLINIRIGPFIL